MSTPAAALARRAVACKGWRWMAGMMSLTGWMCYEQGPDGVEAVEIESGEIDCAWGDSSFDDPKTLELPDLSHPGTLGCMLALVREAWGMGCAVNVHHSSSAPDWHSVRVFHAGAPRGDLFEGYGAESYVAALEAAPS